MNKRYKIIDLSHKIFPDMPSYPSLPPFRIENLRTATKNGTTVNIITSMHTHLGTHIDFPLHVIPGSKSLDDYTLEDLSGDGVVIDLTPKGEGEEITEKDLKKYGDHINDGDIVFIFTGWSKIRNHTSTYLFRWPHIGESAAHYLAKKNIKILGIDVLSVGGWGGKVAVKGPLPKIPSRKIHEILFNAGMLVVEEVANLDKVLMGRKVAKGFFLIAPLLIKEVEASPCRVFFIVPDL
jgi:arylformamidase